MTYEESKARLEAEYFIVREGRTVHRRDTGEQVRQSHFVGLLAAPYRYGLWSVVNYAYSPARRWLNDPTAAGYVTLQEAEAAMERAREEIVRCRA
jgi:hypothetical protein